MPFKPGQSGNPAGRPPKTRVLTGILEHAGNKLIETSEGVRVARKKLIAELTWQILTTGKARFPDGTILEAAPKDWLETAKWVYSHIDGPAKAAFELSGPDGGPIVIDGDMLHEAAKKARGE